MEIKISSNLMFKILLVLCCIIFIGLCIEAGGFIFNTIYTMFVNPIASSYFWKGIDFSTLYNYDKGYFVVIASIMSIVAILKAIMFYLIIKVLLNKELSISKPFNNLVRKFILIVAYITIGIGFFSSMGFNYITWLTEKGVVFPDTKNLSIDGADVWYFMGVTLFVIAYVFKRGIEIQSENDLTI